MIKLNILNINSFLDTVNSCSGRVNILYPDGRKININKQYGIQNQLLKQYWNNKKSLLLSLDIPTPEDYMSIVSYYAGDC